MRVIVCLKQVPGTTQSKIEPQTNTLIREGVKGIINPFDTRNRPVSPLFFNAYYHPGSIL